MTNIGTTKRVSTYRVYYREGDETQDIYIQAISAQQAVDFARGDSDDIEIIDVAKVVNNWK